MRRISLARLGLLWLVVCAVVLAVNVGYEWNPLAVSYEWRNGVNTAAFFAGLGSLAYTAFAYRGQIVTAVLWFVYLSLSLLVLAVFVTGVTSVLEESVTFVSGIFSSEPEDGWRCVERGQNMFSMSDSGELGAAEKGCTCEEMANFEYRVFGEVDFEALKDDHGCSF